MRSKPSVLLGLAGCALGLSALAQVPPAATLLVPYFEVDDVGGPGCAQARNTTVAVTNPEPFETLAKVTVWSDLGIPLVDFNVYFHPATTVDVDLGEMFCQGNIPITGPTQPPGSVDDPGADFLDCDDFFPFFVNPVIRGSALDRLRGATGDFRATQGGCAGHAHGDGVARGYITIDLVAQCTLLFPTDPNYDAELVGADVLTGTISYRGLGGSYNLTAPVVPVVAGSFGPGDHTFYGRYDGGSPTGADARAPLPSRFLSPLVTGPAGSTMLVYWREGSATGSAFFDCAVPPPPLGGLPDNVQVFDTAGAPGVATVAPPLLAGLFRWTGVPGTPALGVADIDLSHGDINYPDPDVAAQAWVMTINDPIVGLVRLDPGTVSTGIFRSGFEQPLNQQ